MGKIVWLASYPRSGNTWLRAFLHNLLRDPAEPYDINRLKDFSLNDSDARWYRALDPRPVRELSKEEVAALRPKAHAAMTKAFPDTIFVKTHNALAEDRGTPMITMEYTAGAIYLIRNPLDVCVSYAAHYGVSLDRAVEDLNGPWTQSASNEPNFVYELHGSWSQHVGSWTDQPSPGMHIARYEDLLAEPIEGFGRIAAFLGLEVSPDRLERAVAHSSFAVLQGQERQRGFKERSLKSNRFFREGRAGAWKEVLSPAQVDQLTEAHAERMTKFGYLPLEE